MDEDKVKYSDLIQDDGAIEKLIKQLSEVNKSYETMINAIRAGADRIVHAVKMASSATQEGKKQIDDATSSASRLERAYKELDFAVSDTGKKVAWLKAQTVDYNKATVEQQRYLKTAISSYDRIKADLKEHVALYKSLTAAERENSEMGEKVLDSILQYKTQLAALDAQMKPHIQALTAVQKAEQKLAYLRSDEGKRLLELQAQIRAEVAARKEQKVQLTELEKAQRRLAAARSSENEQLKIYALQTQEANKIAELNARISQSAEGSYNRLSAQYELNKIQLNKMSVEERSATKAGQELEKQTAEIYAEMVRLQEATGNYRLSVGNYKKSWDGLSVSVSQVIRELPAAAVSLNTFFLGISNNIPMLVDEIGRLREQNKKLAADGKETVSVTKSIAKALFSINSILVILLTVFSMYGDQIINSVVGLFKYEKATISASEATKELNKELKNGVGDYGRNYTAFKRLTDQYRKFTSQKDKLEFIEDNKTAFENLGIAVNSVADADLVFISRTPAVVEALKLRAKATAANELATKKYQEAFVKEQEITTLANSSPDLFDKIIGGFLPVDNKTGAALSSLVRIDALNKEAKAAREAGDAYYELGESFTEAYKKILRDAGINIFEGGKESKGRQPRDAEDTLESLSLAATKAYQESVTELEREEIKKRRKQTLEAYNVEVADLQKKYNKIQRILDGQDERYKKLTDEQKNQAIKAQEDIVNAIANIQSKTSTDLSNLTYAEQEHILTNMLNTTELQAEAAKKGSEEELQLRLRILEIERQIAIARNKQLPPSEQQSEADINAGFNKQRTGIVTDYNMTEFDQQQALDEAEFNSVERTEREITRFKLQQEKDRWLQQIALAEAGSLDWSQKQIDAAKATVKGIDKELNELDSLLNRLGEMGVTGTILEKLGFDDNAIDAFQQAVDTVLSNLQEIAQAEADLAQAAVDAAAERVEAAQSAYEAELEARNNGYANSVASARRELQQEKKNQREKQKLLEEAQRRQQAIDTITQSSSLITASANIWSSMSKVPIVGPALAVAAIASMWASFAAAKIKARQVTAASEEYGEGGLEFLEGGSHASGHDIDLGVSNKHKKRMRAEGGEALAIINKQNTRKYRRVLPDVIESLNKGVFEDKYSKAFEQADNMSIAVTNNTVDLSRIEAAVLEMASHGKKQTVVKPDGSVIEINGRTTRLIKQ